MADGGKFARIAGLFKTKRPGMLVGACRGPELETLISKIKEAKAASKGITFFLFSNPPKGERGPVAGLTVDVEQERPQGGGFQGRPKAAAPKSDPLAGLFGDDSEAAPAGASKDLGW